MRTAVCRSSYVILTICLAVPLMMGQSCWLLEALLPAGGSDTQQTTDDADSDGTNDDTDSDGTTDDTDSDGTDDTADAPYEILKLEGGESYADTQATAINEQGQVVGMQSSNGVFSALWTNGTSGSLWGRGTAADINDEGVATGVDGDYADPLLSYNILPAVCLIDGVLHQLGATTGRNGSIPASINSDGDIVGVSYYRELGPFYTQSTNQEAFLYQNEQMTSLGTLTGDTTSYAHAINDQGQIVGISQGDAIHAFLWENGAMTELDTLDDLLTGGDTIAVLDLDINNEGQVLVSYRTTNGASGAYIYENAARTLLDDGFPTDGTVSATAINDLGQVVGTIDNASDWDGEGFLWEDGAVTALLELLPDNTDWESVNPRDINDAGQIVGVGEIDGDTRGFVMTPTE